MNRPESAAWREPCERRERPPGRLGSVTDCVWGEGERGHEVHHVHQGEVRRDAGRMAGGYRQRYAHHPRVVTESPSDERPQTAAGDG